MEVDEIATFQKTFTNDMRKTPSISETRLLECKDNKEVSINETEEGKIPQPIFKGKSTENDDSSVPVTNQLMSLESSLGHFVNNNENINENSSEEMKLSLVSWYSEPNGSSFYQEGEGSYEEDEIRKINCGEKDCTNTKVNSNKKANEKDIKSPDNNYCKINNNETVNKRKVNKINNQSTSLEYIHEKYNTNTVASNEVKSKPETITGKIECPRCSRRSKSSNTTPCSGPSSSSRRIIQSSKEISQNAKTPIKSILKPSCLNKSSNMSCFNQRSSVDNLTRSGITDKNSNENNSSSKMKLNSKNSEDKLASGLKRIEKYATLRPRKKGRVGPAYLKSSQEDVNKVNESNCNYLMSKSTSTRNNIGCEANDLMTKSMSFLEKNSSPFRRQGSLILRNTSPMPSGTRTSALRLMKIQEAKVKGSTNTNPQHFANNGNIVESLQNKSIINPSVPSNSTNNIVFSKLASASGQTESSKLKRLRQERGVQTEFQCDINNSISPIPLPESSVDDAIKISSEELFKWERLAKRYRNTALRFQYEYEKANTRNQELNKQLNENQIEAKEMIEFLQAEKLALAETLAESETELKNVNEKNERINKETDLKHTNLVKLNEHYKQEALRAQALLNKLEIQSNSKREETNELKNSSLKIQHLKFFISSINDSLLEKYQLKQVSENGSSHEVDLNLLHDIKFESKYRSLGPLVSFLSEATKNLNADEFDDKEKDNKKLQISEIDGGFSPEARDAFEDSDTSLSSNLISLTSKTNSVDGIVNDFNELRIQAVKERDEAEHNGFDTYLEGITSTGAPSLIKNEIFELNEVFKIFLNSIKRILVLYDGQAQATQVSSNILQCLKSMDEEQLVGKHPTETMQNSSPQTTTTTWNGKDSKSQNLIQNDQLTQGKECIFNGNGINSTSF